ncbi:MAG: NUDIX hydrolase [Chlamydiia bacterium]|nr:NUDIX hydrolase [Chlamydiia bacterium]MCP5509518.1 NUDIX hydrolase [Chlamydiales bacterium]HPE84866.1 NUDIX hydrolase [Chlamydiales bacterium]
MLGKVFIICAFSLALHCCDVENYLNFMQKHVQALGPFGSHKSGEIELSTNQDQIHAIQKTASERLIKEGYSPAEAKNWTRVGIIAEDQYWIWVRDPVLFPSGHMGTYNRILWRPSLDGPQGVAILPVFQNDRFAVNLNYRHATRSWEIEVPRGARYPQEDPEIAARRECLEETGLEIDTLTLLGEIAPDTGMTASVVPVYTGKVSTTKLSTPEDSEAIHKILTLTRDELVSGLIRGYIDVSIHGKPIKAYCRDSFLAYALLLSKKV